VFGLLLEDYAVALLVLGFVVTFVGQDEINGINLFTLSVLIF